MARHRTNRRASACPPGEVTWAKRRTAATDPAATSGAVARLHFPLVATGHARRIIMRCDPSPSRLPDLSPSRPAR
jgi:hypothetical protein